MDPLELKRELLAELAKHPFRPPWWLRGAHAQTMWGSLFRRPPRLPWRTERWTAPDGDFLRIHRIDGRPEAPVVLLLHGLEGSVRSHYMLGMAAEAAGRGWSVAALDFRTCGGEMNRARRAYHSGETTDCEFVAGRLLELHPRSRLYVFGVSLGGNVTAKWFGEKGDALPARVAAGASISPPFDLTVSSPVTDRSLGGFYTWWFLRTLKPKAAEKAKLHPGALDPEKVLRSRTFAEFDTHATAALHGFRDATHYYESVSCGQFLEGVRRPLLLIAAEDDPFNPGSTHPRRMAEEHPHLHPLFTPAGGHVGFVHGRHPRAARNWAEEQAARFFEWIESRAAGNHEAATSSPPPEIPT